MGGNSVKMVFCFPSKKGTSCLESCKFCLIFISGSCYSNRQVIARGTASRKFLNDAGRRDIQQTSRLCRHHEGEYTASCEGEYIHLVDSLPIFIPTNAKVVGYIEP